ncbi:MAG: glycosyltransferase [Clostridia bacterium]|nr:glycosyltransferase [Clostridia bacterium]
MRILVYGLVGTNRGGIETYLLKMNKQMSADTIFDYVVEGDTCIHEPEIAEKGGRIYYIPQRHKQPMQNIQANKKLLKSLRSEIDTVYFNLSSLSWIKPIQIACKLGYKVFVHSHNAEFIKNNSSLPYRVVNAINKNKLHKMKVHRLTCSKPATDFMFKSEESVTMIYNAIDTKKFSFNSEVRRRIREQYNVREEDTLIGFVGRLQYQKNPLFLPEILKACRVVSPSYKMLVVGDGDMRQQVEEKFHLLGLNENVIFTGNCTNVNELLQGMDAFLLPSHHEGLPYVAVEAQTAGLPCFLSDKVTRETKIIENVMFLPIDKGAELWSKAISSAINAGVDREKSAEIVRNSNFEIRNEAKRLEKILTAK